METFRVLAVSDLSFSFKHKTLFQHVSFQLSSGKILQIKGPNGSGKTTLLAVLAGLIEPQAGEISFGTDKKPKSQSNFEYLPAEANNLFLKLDAMENLRFWIELRRGEIEAKEIIAELERWQLGHPLIREKFPVERFSTGMKRRLALARLNLSKTSLWLLDEPLWGLDSEALKAFNAMMTTHLSNGGAAVVISHDWQAFQNLPASELNLETCGQR